MLTHPFRPRAASVAGSIVAAALLVIIALLPANAGIDLGSGPAPGVAGSGIGVIGGTNRTMRHIGIVWDEMIDPTSLPAPTDFAVAINSSAVKVAPTGVRLVYSGFADEAIIGAAGGVSIMRLDLGFTWTTGVDQLTLSYTPGANPVRDFALNEAVEFTDRAVEAFDFVEFFPIGPAVDEDYGRDRMLLATSLQIDSTSIPAPSDFVVRDQFGTDVIDVVSVTHVHADSGMGFLDLGLASAIHDPSLTLYLEYIKGANPIISLRNDIELESFPALPVVLILRSDSASSEVGAGGMLTTATADGTTASDPLATSVTSPMGGTVTISEGAVTESTSGYEFFGQQVEITAPDGSPAAPLVIQFDIDASIVPAGHDATTIEILRNGVAVPDCTGAAGAAEPSPCISSRLTLPDGSVSITVLTAQASTWNFGLRLPVAFDGFYAPVDNHVRNGARAGSAIPLKFSLGGDRGLDVFAAGSPSSRPVSCTTSDPYDEVEQTVTAGGSSLEYSASTDTYTYVWKTDRSWSGCRKLTVTFFDGTNREVVFQFR